MSYAWVDCPAIYRVGNIYGLLTWVSGLLSVARSEFYFLFSFLILCRILRLIFLLYLGFVI